MKRNALVLVQNGASLFKDKLHRIFVENSEWGFFQGREIKYKVNKNS